MSATKTKPSWTSMRLWRSKWRMTAYSRSIRDVAVSTEEATVDVTDLNVFVTMVLLEGSPAVLLLSIVDQRWTSDKVRPRTMWKSWQFLKHFGIPDDHSTASGDHLRIPGAREDQCRKNTFYRTQVSHLALARILRWFFLSAAHFKLTQVCQTVGDRTQRTSRSSQIRTQRTVHTSFWCGTMFNFAMQESARHDERRDISAQVHHSDVSDQSGHAPWFMSPTSVKMKVEPFLSVYRGLRWRISCGKWKLSDRTSLPSSPSLEDHVLQMAWGDPGSPSSPKAHSVWIISSTSTRTSSTAPNLWFLTSGIVGGIKAASKIIIRKYSLLTVSRSYSRDDAERRGSLSGQKLTSTSSSSCWRPIRWTSTFSNRVETIKCWRSTVQESIWTEQKLRTPVMHQKLPIYKVEKLNYPPETLWCEIKRWSYKDSFKNTRPGEYSAVDSRMEDKSLTRSLTSSI